MGLGRGALAKRETRGAAIVPGSRMCGSAVTGDVPTVPLPPLQPGIPLKLVFRVTPF